MASTIGIKIANGEFYSIIDEHSAAKKRLILTTVHDKQQSVQIDLYRSVTRTMADAQYIGSLVVENINPNAKGEPSIEMIISSNPDGDITADAVNLDASATGEHQILNVSLQSLDEETREDEIPDFELEENDYETSEPSGSLYEEAELIRQEEEEEEEKKKFPWLLVIILGVLIIVGLLAVWFFFFKDKGGLSFNREKPGTEMTAAETPEMRSSQAEEPPAPPPPPPPPPPVEKPPAQVAAKPPVEKPPAQTAAQPPVIKAPAAPPPARPQTTARKRPPAPVWSYKVPATIPRNGVAYKIRWGDTLWDIAGAFYRNPWQYHRIARFNNIKNPDKIVAGSTIRIPPRN